MDDSTLIEQAVSLLEGRHHTEDRLRIAVTLENRGCSPDVVVAALLREEHDRIDMITAQFGEHVGRLIGVLQPDPAIWDEHQRRLEINRRCIAAGRDAALIRAAEIYDQLQQVTALSGEELEIVSAFLERAVPLLDHHAIWPPLVNRFCQVAEQEERSRAS